MLSDLILIAVLLGGFAGLLGLGALFARMNGEDEVLPPPSANCERRGDVAEFRRVTR